MRLAEPGWLILLPLVIAPWLLDRTRPRLAWPSLSGFRLAPRGRAPLWRAAPLLLRSLALAGLIAALARPQSVGGAERVAGRGVGIVVVLDRSSSMEATDFPTASGRPGSRLEAAKDTVARFVAGRPDDVIGLVAFANYPDLAVQPTLDHRFLVDTVGVLRPASDPGEDGTNIGDAIIWGLEALRPVQTVKKVLILLTDGENRPQGITPPPADPREAARLAGELGVTLHTIAVGQSLDRRRREPVTGLAYPGAVEGPDPELLLEMAELTGGETFTAGNEAGLRAVYDRIDRLERSLVQGTVHMRYREWFALGLAVTVLTLGLDRLLGFERLP